MDERYHDSITLEHEITKLLGVLQNRLRGPSFSYRLEDIRATMVRLIACWMQYRRERPAREAYEDEPRPDVYPYITAVAVEDCRISALATTGETSDEHAALACQAQVSTEHSPRPCGFATIPHATDLQYTRQELEALFRAARQEDVEWGGRYDARCAAINLWTQPWPKGYLSPLSGESTLVGTWYFQWHSSPCLWQISTDAGWTLADLRQALGQLEWKALGSIKHGDKPVA